MRNHHLVLAATLALSGCTAANPDAKSLSLSGPDNPCITIDITSSDLECKEGLGSSVLDYAVHTTHGTATATVTVRIDGGADTTVDTIASADFTTSGGISSATGDVKLDLANGTHSIVLCVVQGTNHDCTPALSVDVACEKEDNDKPPCNQGVGNGPEGCDPGNSNNNHGSNDENGGKPGDPGRAHNQS